MVIAIREPVFAARMASLINKYVLSGSCSGYLQQSCEAEQVKEDEKENLEAEDTTISDADVHVHCH